MFNKILIFCMIFLVFSSSAYAHVMNRNNIYEDLSITEAADEIVLLSSLGIISYLDGSYEYKPKEVLSAKDLAAWVASYNKLSGETSMALAEAALKEGYISTLKGDATYQLVNDVYFQSKLTIEKPDAKMTREEFANFVVSNIRADLGGHTLLDMSGFGEGPTGTIEDVERVKKQRSNGSSVYVYMLTINGHQYELGMHPRVIFDSTDPAVWIGENVAESFYGPNVATDSAGVHSSQEHHNHSHEGPITLSGNGSSDVVSDTALQFLVIGEEPITLQKGEEISAVKEKEGSSVEDVPMDLSNKEVVESENRSYWGIIFFTIVAVLAITALTIFLMRKKK